MTEANGDESPDGDLVQKLKQAEAAWMKAGLAGNARQMERLLADDILIVARGGSSRSKWEAIDRAQCSEVRLENVEFLDRRIVVRGSIGMIQGRSMVRGTVDDRDVTGEYAFTRVWERRKDGSLVMVTSHASPVAED